MPVLYQKRDRIGWLTLSRPQARNCWGEDFDRDIPRLCEDMAADPDIRVAVLTGDEAGGAFSAGADLKDQRTHSAPAMAEFITGLPQVALGILPNHGGLVRLARWVGKGWAMKLGMGFPIKAEEAHRIGLAQWLVPHGELETRTMALAGRLAELPPLALRLVKESLNRGLDIPNVADAAYVDLYRFMALSLTEEAKESHQAWRERRRRPSPEAGEAPRPPEP